MPNQALKRAIEIAGSQLKLAGQIGVRQSHVSFWLIKAKSGVPAEKCAAIEAATGIPKADLRPDIFDAPATKRVDSQRSVA